MRQGIDIMKGQRLERGGGGGARRDGEDERRGG